MKKTLPLLAVSALLASQTYAAPRGFINGYGYNTAPNGLGKITVALSGECQFSQSYTITDASIYLNTPQSSISSGTGLEIGFRSELGNFVIIHEPRASKDKFSFYEGTSIQAKASSTERSVLHYLIDPASMNYPNNYFESMSSDGNAEKSTVSYGNLFDALIANNDFSNASCNWGLVQNKFLVITPQLNSAATKVKSSADYKSVYDAKTNIVTTATKLNTNFKTSIMQAQGRCETKTPLTPEASSYSFSCAAAKPVFLSVSIEINASENFDASEM